MNHFLSEKILREYAIFSTKDYAFDHFWEATNVFKHLTKSKLPFTGFYECPSLLFVLKGSDTDGLGSFS